MKAYNEDFTINPEFYYQMVLRNEAESKIRYFKFMVEGKADAVRVANYIRSTGRKVQIQSDGFWILFMLTVTKQLHESKNR